MNKPTKQIQLFRTTLIIGLLIFIQSCQRHQALPNALEAYSERMYQVLEIEHKAIATSSTLSFPDKTTLVLAIPELSIQMREFYAIENCAIKQHIAKRNTALGKLQLPSVRLQYEWELIELLRDCIKISSVQISTGQANSGQNSAALIAKMQDWLNQKEAIYPLNWANMISQSNEIYLGFSASSGFIDGNENDNFTQGLFALKNVTAMKNQPELNIAELEESLHAIQEHRVYARLWRSQALLEQYLAQMTVDISQWASTFTCTTRKDKEKLAIIRNVFKLFFVQEIQRIGSQVNHYHYSLKPELLKLTTDTHLPAELTSVIAKYSQSEFDNYQEAMLEHVKMWQNILEKCS